MGLALTKVERPDINTDLNSLGLRDVQEIFHNLAYEDFFAHETNPDLTGSERGVVTSLGAVAVDTGCFTGRSPKDKYIVKDEETADKVWWASNGSDNKPIDQKTWEHLKSLSTTQLSGKKLYVMDGFCGANPKERLSVRLVTEVAWMAHFFKNMFIRPTAEELSDFEPDWTILNACKTQCNDFESYGLNSENFVAFNVSERMTCIGGTWYGGEIKKGIFSIMNYFLPLQGIGSFHCSANMGCDGDTALFFGLSGTGKTTLSADPNRRLIGDDEHGWDDDGIFNLEGGCYAKTIRLSAANEPDIYHAIKRDALLENVVVDGAGVIDFDSSAKTENTRVSYPIYHIENIVTPLSAGPHPNTVIFLTCDAYGVLPPVARLNREQAMYQFLSGYTAKVAGTELGIKEPTAAFSACFGQPFLLLEPSEYAEILGQKIDKHGTRVYMINTGWMGGPYGIGERIPIKATRTIVNSVLDGSIENTEWETFPIFSFDIPKTIAGIEPQILQQRESWKDPEAYDNALNHLAELFVKNFHHFSNTTKGKALLSAGPQL